MHGMRIFTIAVAAVWAAGARAADPGRVEFDLSRYYTTCYDGDLLGAVEESGAAILDVRRSSGSSGPVSVRVWTRAVPDSEIQGYPVAAATPGVDYEAIDQTLSWADGETGVRSIKIPLIDDAQPEGWEVFDVRLEALGGDPVLGCTQARFSIYSDIDGVRSPVSVPSPSPSPIPADAVSASGGSSGGGALGGFALALQAGWLLGALRRRLRAGP